jgi:acyl-CoA hydrolase
MSDPKPRTVAASRIELAELIMPQHANLLGKAFGGVILGMIDKAAATCAIRHSGKTCVTASFDHVSFRSPIEIGELVRILASVNFVGRSSMEVGVKVLAMNIATGDVRHTNSSYVTMVAIDKNGHPIPVPALTPETDEDRRRHHEGAERAAERKRLRDRKQI